MTFSILPPAPNKCQCCAVDHPPEQPHDATSFYFQMWAKQSMGVSATWEIAMAHCTPEIKQHWLEHLKKLGIDPASSNLFGDIKTTEDVERRLK